MSWRVRQFGEMVSLRNGVSFSAGDRGGDLPVLGVGDFVESRLVSSDHLATVKMAKDPRGISYLEPGDLVFVRSNGSRDLVGRCLFVSAVTRPTTHSGFTIKARVTSPDLNPRWAAAFFQSGMADRALGRGAPGTNINNVTQGILASVELPVPPREVQDRLVKVLEIAGRARTQLESLIIARRAFKRGLLHDLLTGRRRFPEFGSSEWVRRPLADFLQEKCQRNRDGSIGLVYSCSKLYGVVPQTSRFKHRVAARDTGNYKVVVPGDLVFDPMLLWDTSIGFVPPGRTGVVSPAYTTLTFDETKGSRQFFSHALRSHFARHMYRVMSRGTNVRRKKVLAADFLRITVPVPATRQEQARIGQLLAAYDAEIDAIERQAELYSRLKRGLMQKLLSGDIEVPQGLGTNGRGPDDDSDDPNGDS